MSVLECPLPSSSRAPYCLLQIFRQRESDLSVSAFSKHAKTCVIDAKRYLHYSSVPIIINEGR